MGRNVSSFDRGLRLIIALIIGYLFYIGYLSGAVGIILLVLSVAVAITSFVGYCPLYQFLGWQSCSKKKGQ